ncbi:hypothetical protein E4T42_07937 [Aureobasidium subglaciale]|nr:hypothetical protein E4T42_07937 [Aureobasidium subglaciale]
MNNIKAEQAEDVNMKDSSNGGAPSTINVANEAHDEYLPSKTSVPVTNVEKNNGVNAENTPSDIAKDEATVTHNQAIVPVEEIDQLRRDNVQIMTTAYSQMLARDKIIHGKNKHINNLEYSIKRQLVAVNAYNTLRDDYWNMKREYEDKLAAIKTEMNGMVGLSRRMKSCADQVEVKRDRIRRLIDDEESDEEPEPQPEPAKTPEGEVIMVDSSEDESAVPEEPASAAKTAVTEKSTITEEPVVAGEPVPITVTEEPAANEEPPAKRVKFAEGV